MKKIILFLICSTLCLQQSFAQPSQRPGGGGNGVAESLKIAYITKELNLTSSEAEKFWPVYNAYVAEIKKAKKESTETSDPLVLEEQILNIRKKYKDSFKKLLGSDERANKLYAAEINFGKMIRNEWQKRSEQFKKMRKNGPNKNENTPAPPPGN